MEIYLNNDIIDDMQISDEELCVYIALKSIYQSSRNKQYITYNMILYELVGNFSFKRSLYKKVKSAFESLVNKNLILIDNKVSASEFIVNLSGLYFTSDFTTGKGKYYTIVYSDEVQAILNLDNKIDKLKLLRYFVVCMRTINKTKDQLGKVQSDTRNPIIASELEVLKITENRYSGIPTIRRAMREYNLPEPEFLDERGCFIVKLYKYKENEYNKMIESSEEKNLIIFCKTPRTRNEICHYLGINSVSYVMKKYVMPLVERGILKMSIPDKPKSTKQLFYCE